MKIAHMVPLTQPQTYEVVIPKRLKKPLVQSRQKLRVTHKTLSKAALTQKKGQLVLGFPMQISSKQIEEKGGKFQHQHPNSNVLPFLIEKQPETKMPSSTKIVLG